MRVTLRAHSDFPSACIEEIVATAERRSETELRLHYCVRGDIGGIVLPPPAVPARADGLWETTCFEAFLPLHGTAYREFNFSPSGAWAAYEFEDYRAGMREAAMPAAPAIAIVRGERRLEVEIVFSVDPVLDPQRLALTAIIEEARGGRSFWAARHASGEPDFHHPGCFVDQLPPAPQP